TQKEKNPYRPIIDWFESGGKVDILNDMTQEEYYKTLGGIPGLKAVVERYHKGHDRDASYFLMEFLLHGLAEFSLLSKKQISTGFQFSDLLSGMFNMNEAGDDPDEEDDFRNLL